MTDGIVEVQSRIAELRRMFPTPALATSAALRAGAGSSRVDTSAFATALATAQTEEAATAPGGGLTGADVVNTAKRYLGVPYVWGGTNPATGLDCSGLVQRTYADLGISLPRVSGDQARAGVKVDTLAEARPGDLLAFGHPVHHVGIYVGDGKMLEAPRPGKNVRIAPITDEVTAIRRIIPDHPVARPSAVAASRLVAAPSGDSSAAGRVPYSSLFRTAAAKHGVPAALLAAVAKAESDFRPGLVSDAGARGMMQIMPGTARELGVDPFNPTEAVDGAARLLAGHIRKFGGIPLALAAYNAGPGAVARYGGIPPYGETRTYVARVQKFMGEVRV